MPFTLARLRALAAVVETGGFSAAARQLGVAQATISQQIRDLEKAVSAELFERGSREMVPTALCRQIFASAGTMLEAEQQIAALVTRHRNLEEGELRVGLGNPMPGMALIRHFQRLCPSVNVKIEMGSWGKIFEAVVERRVDVAVLPEVPADKRFRRQPCQTQTVVAIVHPEHRLAARRVLSCHDLLAERLIFRTPGSSTQRVVDAGFRSAGLTVKPSIVLDTRDGVMDAVANDLGVGFMWNRGTTRHGAYVQVPCREMEKERTDCVFSLASVQSPLADMFLHSVIGFSERDRG